MLPAGVGLHILREIPLVRRHQKVIQRNGVRNKFNDSCIESERKNLVGSDPEVSLPSRLMVFEQAADLLKDLLHDRVLTKVVVSSFVLFLC
jgi:hypothetical protein